MNLKHLLLWVIVPLVQWLLRTGFRRLVGAGVITREYSTSLEVLILTLSLPEFNDKAVVAWGVTVIVFLPTSLLLIYIEAKW